MGSVVVGVRTTGTVVVGAALALLLALPAGGQEPMARPAPPFTLQGSGEGSGVGLSQWGARALAREGHTHSQILQHFYTDVSVEGHPAAQTTEPLRLGLFHDNPAVAEPAVLRLTALRADDGGAVDVRLAPDGSATRVAAGQTWTVEWDSGIPIVRPPAFVLRNASGTAVARGAGPVTVDLATAGEPALQLPQIAGAGHRGDGRLRRGRITVTRDAGSGHLHPVLRLPLEDYLVGVDEIPSSFESEALRAQAVLARTTAARTIAAGLDGACGCHVGFAPQQPYVGAAAESSAWVAAVDGTAGQAVTADGALIEAFHAPAHAGSSEHSEESWAFGGQSVPYLRSASDPWVTDTELASANPWAAWTHEIDHAALAGVVGLATVTEVAIAGRTVGGTPRVLEVSGWRADGQRITGRRVSGDTIGVAGAELFLALRAQGDAPPSQQVGVLRFTDFPDVTSSSLHAYNIAAVADRGVAAGRADGTFDPRSGIRRDQMASFLARALDLPLDPGADDRFDDVPPGSTHRDAVNAVAAAGIAQGVAPRRYAPAATVTRDQMATFIARAFDLGERDQDRFTDTGQSVHRRRINAVAAAGITSGCTPELYCPRQPVSRDQMASFLARALGFGW